MESTTETKSISKEDEILFSADQVQIPLDLPNILKDLSKEILREKIKGRSNIFSFCATYFQEKVELMQHLEAAGTDSDDDKSNS